MNTPIAIKIECARGEILNAMAEIQKKYDLPPCIMDGVLATVTTEVKAEAKIELINATNAILKEKNREVEQAREEAKKVLKADNKEEVKEVEKE